MIKRKIINDPVYGFISINNELIFELIEHPFFQRLRHIKQLGLTEFVYPGALHTRFHHALGALHLMGKTLESLRSKGVEITPEEFEAAQIAILLHDIGHGPFSHTLEETLLQQVHHESLSYLFMRALHKQLGGLDLAIKIFQNTYARKFFHQLVSSQLDIDRLDYLKRDSYFTGVAEGAIGVDRIIDMLHVSSGKIVVEEKGINTIEHFLNARRLMYWQVYLHKTSVSAERMLVNIIRRAQYLSQSGERLTCTDSFRYFLKNSCTIHHFQEQASVLNTFGQLDDHDLWGAVKHWRSHPDPILSQLCQMLLHRQLFQIKLSNGPIGKPVVEKVRTQISRQYKLLKSESSYLYSWGTLTNEAYLPEGNAILILSRDGKAMDLAQVSDLPNIKAMSKIVKKNYLCWPKDVSLS
jgi:uncharacterized protein